MKYVEKALSYFEEITLCLLFSAMPLLCLFQVLCRHVFRFPAAWTEELMRALFVWGTFIGASLGVKHGAHLGVTAICNLLPRRAKSLALVTINAVCALFCAFFAYSGYEMIAFQTMLGQLLPVSRLSVAWTTACLPVGFAFMTIRFIIRTAEEWDGFRKGAPEKNLLMEAAAAEAGYAAETDGGEDSK